MSMWLKRALPVLVLLAIIIVPAITYPVRADERIQLRLLAADDNWVSRDIAAGETFSESLSAQLKGIDAEMIRVPDWVGLQYRLSTPGKGATGQWTPWRRDLAIAPGPANAIAILLLDPTRRLDLAYRVKLSADDGGSEWSAWVDNGVTAGDPDSAAGIIALQLRFSDIEQDHEIYELPWENRSDMSDAPALVQPFADEARLLKQMETSPEEATLRELARVRFGHAMDYLQLAEEGQDTDALEMANRYLLAAIEAASDRAEYWRMLGIIRARFDDDAYRVGAVLALEEAVALDPSHLDTRLLLAESAASVEMHEMAMTQLAYILDNSPERLNASVASLLTRSAIESGHIDSALKYLRKAKANVRFRIAEAMLMAANGEITAARTALESIINKESDSPVGVYARVILGELVEEENPQ